MTRSSSIDDNTTGFFKVNLGIKNYMSLIRNKEYKCMVILFCGKKKKQEIVQTSRNVKAVYGGICSE